VRRQRAKNAGAGNRITKGAMARAKLNPATRRDGLQRVAGQIGKGDLRQKARVERKRRPLRQAMGAAFLRQHRKVEPERMANHHAPGDKVLQRAQSIGKGWCIRQHVRVYARNASCLRRHLACIDEGLEGFIRLAPARRQNDAADLDQAGLARIKPRGFSVERNRLQRKQREIALVFRAVLHRQELLSQLTACQNGSGAQGTIAPGPRLLRPA
jgi:hypothetical protein